MSMATKFCANIFSKGLRSLFSCSSTLQASHITQRNFHVLTARPLEAAATNIKTLMPTAAAIMTPTVVVSRLLLPINTLLNQVAGFKVKARLRRRCKDCYFVIRHNRHYVICPTHRRHKQMSMKQRDYKSWILTHATQSKIRPY